MVISLWWLAGFEKDFDRETRYRQTRVGGDSSLISPSSVYTIWSMGSRD